MLSPFNVPYFSGKELDYIKQAIDSGHLSGNGSFTKKCQKFLENRYGFKKALLTTSCTDALEMAAILCNIGPGDEVIIPSYTFVSTALAFQRHGAVIKFVDSRKDHPGLDENFIEQLITKKTKAIVPVHYGGVACDMDKIMRLASIYKLYVIEDAAHGIESFYKGKSLGSIGHLGCFSFHETKNIQCGEGGMLAINNESFIERSEVIWEKGTNRARFFRGEDPSYEWKDTGSSFLPSELNAAYLYAQIENIKNIQKKRIEIWEAYYRELTILAKTGLIKIPYIPEFASNNGNSFYLICKDRNQRDQYIEYLKEYEIWCLSHYVPLHKSLFYSALHDGRNLPNSELFADALVRLPIYYDMTESQVFKIIEKTKDFFLNL